MSQRSPSPNQNPISEELSLPLDWEATDVPRWNAIVQRDKSFAPAFLYGVTTTGIYCRPGCPSRRPRPDRVRFFATPDDAESAGFLACQRCTPNGPSPEESSRELTILATDLMRSLQLRGEPCALPAIADTIGVSLSTLHRSCRTHLGISPGRLLRQVRAEIQAASRIQSNEPRTSVRKQAIRGASNPTRPSPIVALTVRTKLGPAMVAATPKGLCYLALGDDDTALLADLTARFPSSRVQHFAEKLPANLDTQDWSKSSPALWFGAAVDAINGSGIDPALPLDLIGTACQIQVWEALRQIPLGETLTYGQLAAKVGRPSGIRAVASAVGSNPISVIIPCHRILRADGTLGGYRWGLEKKVALLKRESSD